MKARRFQMREFRCETCGRQAYAAKRRGGPTARGHIKHLWCYGCKAVTAHRQTGEK